MDDQKQMEGWPERFTAAIAGQIRKYREEKGWSFQQLADACTQLGYPTLRTTLANLENGRRKSVTAHELVVISVALNLPPAMLLFPGLADGLVEILPGIETPAWDGVQWVSGEKNLATVVEENLDGSYDLLPFHATEARSEWERQTEPLRLLRRHEAIEQEWDRKAPLLDLASSSDEEADRLLAALERSLNDLRERLSDVRRRMTELGMSPPRVLDGLYDVDWDGRDG